MAKAVKDKFFKEMLDLEDTIARFPRGKRLPVGAGTVEATKNKFATRSIQDYFMANKTLPTVKALAPGFFFSYAYKFALHYKPEKLKYFDYHPLTYIYAQFTIKGKLYYMGINFHRIPIQMRLTLINKMLKGAGVNPATARSNKRLHYNYRNMVPLLMKVKFAVRMYRADRVYNPKFVPLKFIRQMLVFYPETLYRTTVGDLFGAYRTFGKK